ncbi:MAG: hypothetical protein AAF967_03110 [Pseudomonadota bacterium]
MTCSMGLRLAFVVTGVALFTCASQVQASELGDLNENPQNYLEQKVEIKATCIKGGKSGDVLGYECTTKEGVYLNADDITPEEAKDKLANECADGKCETTVTFEPYSYSTSGVVEPGKDVVIFNAKTADVAF